MKENKPGNQYLVFLNLGWIIAGSLTLFLLGGVWLDKKLQTSPVFLLLGLLLAFTGCGFAVYRASKK